MNDLLQASGYAALVYLTFNYLVSFGSGKPLVEWINPGRHYLPFLAGGLFGLAYTLLIRASQRYQRESLDLLSDLVSAESARSEVIGTVMFLVLGVSTLLLWVWCLWKLPRDPRTFNRNPKDLAAEFRRALRHFVRWKGGIDFALLCEVRAGRHTPVAQAADDRAIAEGLARLPAIGTVQVALDPKKAAAEQRQEWVAQAGRIFDELPRLDALVHGSRQGANVALAFDVRYGAVFFEVLERPDPAAGGDGVWLYLFAGTLNEHEVSTMTAGRLFYALADSLRHIRRGVTKK